MNRENESASIAHRDPTEVVALALIEAQYMLVEANMALAMLPHEASPTTPALRDMSPFGR